MSADPDDEAIEKMSDEASDLRKIVSRQARRPFVVELTGTPKAGKTTVISLVAGFFDRCGYNVHVMRERAASCPLEMKGHFFFNTWTTTTMLAELLEVIDTGSDLVILDRGFFDALVWLELQQRRDQITPEERETFEEFVLLERWRALVDAVVVLEVDPAVALSRERNGHLSFREGSLMKPDSLATFNASLNATIDRKRDSFNLLELRADDGAGAKGVALRVIEQLLPHLRERVDPEIAVVPRPVLEGLFGDGGFLPWTDEQWHVLASAVTSERRSEVEESGELVQLVACGIATRNGEVLLFERNARDPRTQSYGRGTIWQGPHVEHAGGQLTMDGVRRSLARRFADDLHLAVPLGADATPVGIVWRPNVGNGHHVGIVIPIEITSETTAEHLKAKKFRTRGRRPQQESRFMRPSDLRAAPDDYALEHWSRAILSSGWPNQ